MEKVIWYVGDNEKDSSLNVIFNGLKKYSRFEYIKGVSDPYSVLNANADFVIGSYRYYGGELLNIMLDSFGSNCFCFIHGFGTKENKSINLFNQRYKRLYERGVKLLVSCSYSYMYLKNIGIDGYIFPFGVDLDEFSFRDKKEVSCPVFGMCFQKRKKHRKGPNVLNDLCDIGYTVKVADSIQHKDLYKFYQQIDCLVVASDDDGRETFCIPIIEAAACGTSTISTKVGCAQDVIINGYNGHIVEDRDNIINIAQNINNFSDMGKAARNVIENKWSWKKVITSCDEVFSYAL